MTLNEVISYLDENAHGDRGIAQLSEWLHELRLLRTEVAILEALRDGFKEDAQKNKAENRRLRKKNDDLTRLANIDAMMIFLSRDCSFKDCKECDANSLCDEALYLQGLYGIDKDLVGIEG